MKIDFRAINQPLSNEVEINGTRYLYFGGTAYLGIPQNQAFIELYLDGIKKFGLNNGTSRNNNIQLGIYNQAEDIAAERFFAEDALITSSGYLASKLTVESFASFGQIVYAPSTHPSLWLDGPPEVLAHSFNNWKEKVVTLINSTTQINWVLVSNAMNNLFPEIYNFDFLKNIHPQKNIVLIVDDSHGIGINHNGLSAYSALPKVKNIACVVVASMAKALGVDAGLVLGSKKSINQLKHHQIFIGASPPSAAGLYAFIKGEKIYREAWEKLQHLIHYFSSAINVTWKFKQGFPAYLIQHNNLTENLLKNRILISSFPYPNPESEPINRIVLSSWHKQADLDQLIDALKYINNC